MNMGSIDRIEEIIIQTILILDRDLNSVVIFATVNNCCYKSFFNFYK